MSNTARIPRAEVTGPFGYLLNRFSRKLLGEVPDALGVMWHNQAVLRSSMGFGRKVQKWDERVLDRDRELRSDAQPR